MKIVESIKQKTIIGPEEREITNVNTEFTMALHLIQTDIISCSSKLGVLTVISSSGQNAYTVRLFPKESSSCLA